MAALLTDENLLELLKIELNKPAAYVSPVLELKLGAARERIEKHGIMLDMTSYDDAELLVAYAAWLYRLKNEDPEKTAMPAMLKRALNDRIIAAVGDRSGAEELTYA
jgi:hypothetical protein